MQRIVKVTIDDNSKLVIEDENTSEIIEYKSFDAGRKKTLKSIHNLLKGSPKTYCRVQL